MYDILTVYVYSGYCADRSLKLLMIANLFIHHLTPNCDYLRLETKIKNVEILSWKMRGLRASRHE
jgi:hypothetical protein